MRDRLIELINNGTDKYRVEPLINGCRESFDTFLADHLLANGVIVPPVVLGSRQKVYIPVSGTTVVYDTKIYGIGVDEDGDMVINPKEYPEKVISISGYNIGKTVFLTNKEAEKALLRGSE
jgi:hypothetical protein